MSVKTVELSMYVNETVRAAPNVGSRFKKRLCLELSPSEDAMSQKPLL